MSSRSGAKSAKSIVHRGAGGQADGETQLAEGEAMRRRSTEVAATHVLGESHRRGRQQPVAEHRAARKDSRADELLDAPGVGEQPAQPERIRRRQIGTDQSGEVLGLRSEVAQLDARDVAVERVVLAHRRHQRPGEIDAHLPVHVTRGPIREGAVRGRGELARPLAAHRLSGRRATPDRARASTSSGSGSTARRGPIRGVRRTARAGRAPGAACRCGGRRTWDALLPAARRVR